MRRRRIAVLTWCTAVAIGCAGCGSGGTRPARSAPLPSSGPYLVMSGPASGWAVWSSGDAWLLLETDDGFRSVHNATPAGVPTDGGLVGAFAGDRAAVAIRPVERLFRSPVVTRTGTGQWATAELPAGVAASRTAVAFAGTAVTALTAGHGGALLVQTDAGWRTLVDARALPGGAGLVLDGVTWDGGLSGWLTGHGRAGGAVAFRTTDGGATWSAVRAGGAGAVAALAPCGEGPDWSLPVLNSAGVVRVQRTRDGGASWTAGEPLPAGDGEPVWGCSGDDVWLVAGSAHGEEIFASSDRGATWSRRGSAPAGLTDLSPTGGGTGFAASGGRQPTLWAVTGDGARFTSVALPSWVATVGGTTGED